MLDRSLVEVAKSDNRNSDVVDESVVRKKPTI